MYVGSLIVLAASLFWPMRTDFVGKLDLSAAVDVYSDWIDACDAVAKDEAGRNIAAVSAQRAARRDSLDDDLEDDFIENDEIDGEAAYAD